MLNFQDIPEDILYQIFLEVISDQHQSKLIHTAITLISLSKQIKPSAERAIYRNISLSQHHCIRSLGSTLRSRSDLSYYIRSINFFSRLSSNYDESINFFAFTNLLQNCHRILKLEISIDGRHDNECQQLINAINSSSSCKTLKQLIFKTRSGSQIEIDQLLINLNQLNQIELSSSFSFKSIPQPINSKICSITFSSSLINTTAQSNLNGILEATSESLRELILMNTQGLRYSSVLNFFNHASLSLHTLALHGEFCNGRHPITAEEPAWELISSLCPTLKNLIVVSSKCRNNLREIDLNLIPNRLKIIELDHQDVKLWNEILLKFNLNQTWLPELERFKFNKVDWNRESIIKASINFNHVSHLST
ncbi:hypothetical protein DFH28DRAFT_114282 [Melampsora americana]|nr:hypothetical protein DFH28DRAFT_114282 [Melampsora americana]